MNEPREISVASVIAERPDMQPTGEFYLELAMTGAVVAAITPHGRREVAGFLQAILARAPVAGGDAYEPHRAILGALVSELETAAIVEALDHPSEPSLPDLRDPGTRDRERAFIVQTRDWADGERSRRGTAMHERIDELLAETEPVHELVATRLDDAVAHAQAWLAAPVTEPDDASWLA